MRLIRACVFAIRSALAFVLAALIYVFVLAVVGPLGAGVALLIDAWAQLRNGHYLTTLMSVLGAVWYLGWGSLLFPVLGIAVAAVVAPRHPSGLFLVCAALRLTDGQTSERCDVVT